MTTDETGQGENGAPSVAQQAEQTAAKAELPSTASKKSTVEDADQREIDANSIASSSEDEDSDSSSSREGAKMLRRVQTQAENITNKDGHPALMSDDIAPDVEFDLNELLSDGLITQEEKTQYELNRSMVDLGDNMGRGDAFTLRTLLSTLKESKALCVPLALLETLNKMMKDRITVPRTSIKSLEPDEPETELDSLKTVMMEDFKGQLSTYTTTVIYYTNDFLERLDEAYAGLDGALKEKYKNHYHMVYSTALKIQADFQRYYAEILSGDDRNQCAKQSFENYQKVIEGYSNIPNGDKTAYALSCQLNLCVLECDIFGDVQAAIDRAKRVLDEVYSKMNVSDYNNGFAVIIVRLIHENLRHWTGLVSKPEDEEAGQIDAQVSGMGVTK